MARDDDFLAALHLYQQLGQPCPDGISGPGAWALESLQAARPVSSGERTLTTGGRVLLVTRIPF
jgi:hypothetical protein